MARTENPRRRYRRRQEVESDSDTGSSVDNDGVQALQGDNGTCCSTPKGKRFKIPEILACPPAPMKPKVAPKLSSSTRTFFSSQDVEIFFFLAFQKCH
ncbi:hypothetical protein like AT3G20898 [Hibiscus trionum]|uniref:Uncharacterized protein n=1 Tax=Hibiscus trionum TaxID=183268 RepID=A0A9W7LVW1_HIBTR|nr:hypothetical protein like AT3G20898 [Hibiscus trionum]